VASYALVAFGTGLRRLERVQVHVIGEIGGMALLLAIALLYARASSLEHGGGVTGAGAAGQTAVVLVIIATFLIGFAVKMAMVPFTPGCLMRIRRRRGRVSALLSAWSSRCWAYTP